MPTSAYHHLALRVQDLERSTAFYERVFDGEVVIELELAADFVHSIFGGPEGSTARNRVIRFDGWAIEILEFSAGEPLLETPQTDAGIMHFCAWVPDVPAAVERVEAAGGRRLFPIRPWQGHHFVYVADPDGHVIELLDATIDDCMQLTRTVGVPDHTVDALAAR